MTKTEFALILETCCFHLAKAVFDLKLEIGCLHYAQICVSLNIRCRLLKLFLKLRFFQY